MSRARTRLGPARSTGTTAHPQVDVSPSFALAAPSNQQAFLVAMLEKIFWLHSSPIISRHRRNLASAIPYPITTARQQTNTQSTLQQVLDEQMCSIKNATPMLQGPLERTGSLHFELGLPPTVHAFLSDHHVAEPTPETSMGRRGESIDACRVR